MSIFPVTYTQDLALILFNNKKKSKKKHYLVFNGVQMAFLNLKK